VSPERQKTAVAAQSDARDIAERVDAGAPLAVHAARGFASIVSGRLVSQGVQFLASIVLARLLAPSAYGLVAITWSFTGFAALFSDLGLSAALVQAPRMTERDAATAFVINGISGLALTLIVVVLRHPLASLFGQPRVANLLALSSLAFTLSLNVVPFAILERQMHFGKVAAIDVVASTVGFSASIVCAALGVGAASLVIGPLTSTTLTSAAGLVAARWLPKAWPSWSSARRLMGFSGHLTGFNVLTYWARNADNLLLGRFAGTTELGLYNRAYMLMLLPLTQVGGVLGRVLLPLFSNMQDDHARLRRAVVRLAGTTSLFVFPVLLGLAAIAHNFVLVAFGPAWRGAIPLIAILAIAGMPQVFGILSAQVCQAVGQPRLLSRWGVVWNLTALTAILAGLHWGAEGVAIALAIRGWVVIPIEMMPARKTIGVGAIEVLRAGARPLAAAAAMAIIVAILGTVFDRVMPLAASLALQVVLGGGIYVALVAGTDRTAFDDALVLVRQRRLRAMPPLDARPAADMAPVSPAGYAAPTFIPFDDVGRKRAPWEDIADSFSPSSTTDGHLAVDRPCRRGDTLP
jgi:O-antigen/teichoic acid export membrane protein